MNTIEERLRAATHAAADTVPADSAPPLTLPARSGRRGLALWLHLPAWRFLAPVAAAAAVAAVVALSVVVTSGSPHPGPVLPGAAHSATPSSGSTPSPAPSPPSAAAQAALASVPPYYVALTGQQGIQSEAVIRATATGAVLGTVKAPAPYGTFDWVSAAADDRTFALAAQPWHNTGDGVDSNNEPTKFFLLRLNAAGHQAALTALPVPAEAASVWVDGIALSPDASRLAVIAEQYWPQVNPKIEVFSVATGSVTEWEWPGDGNIGNQKPLGSPLSWAADGRTLAFQIGPANGTIEVRLLDTATPSRSLTSSTLAVEWTGGQVAGALGVVIHGSRTDPGDSLTGFNTLLTPDGTTIVCATVMNSASPSAPALATEFSVSTGTVTTVNTPVQDVLWSSMTGTTLIVLTSKGPGVMNGNKVTPIPGSPTQIPDTAW
jgi:hypothetical protein